MSSVVYSSDGKTLMSTGGGIMKVWDTTTGRELRSIQGVGSAVAFSPDGQRMVSTRLDPRTGNRVMTITVWNAGSGQVALNIPTPLNVERGSGAIFSADGKQLITTDGIWDAVTGQKIASRRCPSLLSARTASG